MNKEELIKLINKAVDFYNEYRSPESNARFIGFLGGKEFSILFEGPFMDTCGINDWVEDFKYFAEDIGLIVELLGTEEPEGVQGRVGVFVIKKTCN